MIYIKNIQGEFYPNIIDDVKYISLISGEIQREDSVNLNGFVAYLQNFSRAELTSALDTPLIMGLPNQQNITMITLEINY